MAYRHAPKEMKAIAKEVQKSAPRSSILVGAGLLEHALTEMLQAQMRTPTTAEERQYQPGEGEILSTFSEKIWAAYFLRFIGPKTRQELNLIRLLRNECAHNMNPLTFESPGIKERCDLLRHGAQYIPPKGTRIRRRDKFAASVFALTSILTVQKEAVSDESVRENGLLTIGLQ